MQTAVKGATADSEDAVILPIEHDAAIEFREEHRATGTEFWCGSVNGCGRKLFIRIGDDKIPHFYHQGEAESSCRLAQRSRGRHDIEPPIAWAELRRWRVSRGLPEGKVDFIDPLEKHDGRYLHISGPRGTRDTRIVLGDLTIVKVKDDARSPQGREWDWFVHHSNTELRGILDEQGIPYGPIRFSQTKDSAIMQVFLAAADNVGDWGRVSRYEPAPHRPPRPPAPAIPAQAAPRPAPARPSASSRAPVPGSTHERADSLESLRARIARMRGSDDAPTPSRKQAPTTKTPTPGSDGQLPAELAEAMAQLKEALVLGDRRTRARCVRRLRALRRRHRAQLASEDNRTIKALINQASTSI
ncbi:competence protein CoiA [Streptomonospora sp. S1-112]|uniref:Competence protein CoiA n=1 Tax=Streptomonospora mangrovi TaxID=2883123 RepID=A0A9X3NQW8_9ACTN|nr:competence protein CoiA [Streptomonospora mangrovi]